jgi:hypothetical protein
MLVPAGWGDHARRAPAGPAADPSLSAGIRHPQALAAPATQSPSRTTAWRGRSQRSAHSSAALCPTSHEDGSGRASHFEPAPASPGQSGRRLTKSNASDSSSGVRPQ